MVEIPGTTSGARDVIERANERALTCTSEREYPLLLLEALIAEHGMAMGALMNSGCNVEEARAAILRSLADSQNGSSTSLNRFGTLSSLIRILIQAREFATKYRHMHVGHEHLTAAVFAVLEVDQHPILAELGLSAERVQSEIESILGIGLD